MRNFLRISLFWSCVLAGAVSQQAFGQTPATGSAAAAGAQSGGTSITPNRVIGDVTAINKASMGVTLKVDGPRAQSWRCSTRRRFITVRNPTSFHAPRRPRFRPPILRRLRWRKLERATGWWCSAKWRTIKGLSRRAS
jgi:hypothetical protein